MNQDRLAPIPPEQWTDAQRACAQEIINGPRGALISPFVPMLRSPELTGHMQRLGEYLRYRSAIGLRLSELAILVVARHWNQPVEWAIHAPIAAREGIAPQAIDDIGQGRDPADLQPDEQLVYTFSKTLLNRQDIGDALWQAAVGMLGEAGVVDLVGVNGYYANLAMLMNAARTPVPAASVQTVLPAL